MSRPLQLPPEQLHAVALAYGHETAYTVVGVSSLTFEQWDTDATRLARGLIDAGVGPGDRVAIHLEPVHALQWVTSYSAIHRAGAVAVPFNPQLAAPEVERMLAHSGAAVAVTEVALLPRYEGRRPAVLVAVPEGVEGPLPEGASDLGAVAWSDILSTDTGYLQVPREPGDLADILYTSGTTGDPKAVAIRHDNYSLMPFSEPNWSGGAWMHASPPYTFAGIAFVYTPMKLGLRALFMPKFDAGTWLDTVEAERPGSVFLVPAMANLLLEHPRFDEADLTSVQLCSVGSAPLAPFVLERLQDRMPTALVSNNYGMTEAGSVYCLMPPGEAVKRPGSVGKPVPPAEILCVDDDGVPMPSGEVGNVRMRIPGRPREYYGDPDASSRTWVDGWLITGDLGRVDDDGYLYIVGRTKDVIIRGGNNIFPTDVEHVIELHPAVREVAVVGIPHAVLGEDLLAVVALRPDHKASADELSEHTAERLARYKVPRRWEFVDALPRNATGKVVKERLRQQFADSSEEAAASGGTPR